MNRKKKRLSHKSQDAENIVSKNYKPEPILKQSYNNLLYLTINKPWEVENFKDHAKNLAATALDDGLVIRARQKYKGASYFSYDLLKVPPKLERAKYDLIIIDNDVINHVSDIDKVNYLIRNLMMLSTNKCDIFILKDNKLDKFRMD